MLKNFLTITSLLLIVFASPIKAELNYEFKSNLKFKHEKSLSEGELESYTLNEDANVKLLIGLLEKKSVFQETKSLKESEIKKSFLEKESLLDVINNQRERSILGFKKIERNNTIIIQFKYALLKNEESIIEANTYVIDPSNTAFASIQYPASLPKFQQEEMDKGLENFQIISEKKTVFNKMQNSLKGLLTFYNSNSLQSIVSQMSYLVIDSAFAAEAPAKFKACHKADYIVSGEYTTKPGSALFNFQKIVRDLKEETTKLTVQSQENPKTKVNDAKLNCLSTYYSEAKKNASDYWAKRGAKEGCYEGDKILDAPTATCSDSTLKEMKKSFAFLDSIDQDLQSFLTGQNAEKFSCVQKSNQNDEEIDAFKKLNANVQQSFCCGSGNGDPKDQGPLYKLLDAEDEGFKKLSPNVRVELCMKKTSTDPSKTFLSAGGLGDCAQSFFEGLGKLVKDTIKAVSSLFDLATLKALGQFVSDLPESGQKLFQVIGEHIAAQVYSVTDCMSPYESKQYMCKMIPNVAATLLGPGMIKSFAVALVEKTSKTALVQVIAKAAAENKQLQRMQAIAKDVAALGARVTRPIIKSRFVKPSLDILGKITKILGKDVSTPIKEMVLRKAKTLTEKARESAQRVLNKPGKVTLAEEVVGAEAARAEAVMNRGKKPVVAETVQGADGVYREAPASNSTALQPTSTQMPSNPRNLPATTSRDVVPTSGERIYTPTQYDHLADVSAYRDALKAGNELEALKIRERMLSRANNLEDADRLNLAQALTRDGSAFTEEQRKLILEAHNVGKAEGRGFGSYTQDDILKKNRLLEKAGIKDPNERRMLMESGITGDGDSKAFFRNAVSSHFKTQLGKAALTESQTEALLTIHANGMSKLTPKEILVQGGFTAEEADKIIAIKSGKIATKPAATPVQPKPTPTAAPVVKPAVATEPPAPKPVEAAKPVVQDSPGRKAVLSGYTKDELYNYKFAEIPDGLSGEALATKQRARAADAKAAIDRIYKGQKEMDIQGTIYSNGETVGKAKKAISEYEDKLSKLPAKGSDMTRKDLNDKMDRAKASLEVAQKRCRTIVDLYKVGYGIQQFLKQYETDFERNCL